MLTILKLAVRNIGRNKRRSLISALALAIGMTLLFLMSGFLNGEMNSSVDSTIRLQSGHIQIRSKNYNENKTSLKFEDLIQNPDGLAKQISDLSQVLAATPRLYLSGIAAIRDTTAGVKIFGIEPESIASAPYSEGIIDGTNIKSDDRNGILVGKPLAERLNIKVGDVIQLSVNTSNGNVANQNFEIRGIYTTKVLSFDKSTIIMPLAKAQAIGQAADHASIIFILLKNKEDAQAVKQSLQGPGLQIKSWEEMNEFMMIMENMAHQYFSLLFIIVLSITATVIMNTQLMAVFERTREIGILTSMGMKSGRVLLLFLSEAGMLAVAGMIFGIIFGIIANLYFGYVGFTFGDLGLTDVLLPNTIYTFLTFGDIINVCTYSLIITLLAGIYPAMIAARMQPVEALHSSL